MSTGIEWTDDTWNPVTGCTKVSAGCDHCYAERFAERWRGVAGHPYEQGFDLRLHPDRVEQPLRWSRPRRIFVNSMSDLFHRQIPRAFIGEVFDVMEEARRHQFQILTKRAPQMAGFTERRYEGGPAPRNILAGVSVESRTTLHRIEYLRRTPCRRFLSIEPLLERLGPIDLSGIEWVIVGGESGPHHRPMRRSCWVREIRDACAAAGVAFFFKQWGGARPKSCGRELDGVHHDAMPSWP